jgi:hypothetical protein
MTSVAQSFDDGLVPAHPKHHRERRTSVGQSFDDGSGPGTPKASQGEDDKRSSNLALSVDWTVHETYHITFKFPIDQNLLAKKKKSVENHKH